MKNKEMKFVSLMLVSSMLAPGLTFAADQGSGTAELRLMESTLVAQGALAKKDEVTQQMLTAAREYAQESAFESASDRKANMEQAWIDLRLMTPSQAQELSQGLFQNVSTTSDLNALAETTVTAVQHLSGAQYSACSINEAASWGVSLAGWGLFLASLEVGNTEAPNGATIQFHSSLTYPLIIGGVGAIIAGIIGGVYTSKVCNSQSN